MSIRLIRGRTFAQIAQNFQRVLRQLPIQVGADAVRESDQAFRKQKWEAESGTEAWEKRKPNAPRNEGRSILVDTGQLRASVRVLRHNIGSVTIGSSKPYAQIHNEGGEIDTTQNVPAAQIKEYLAARKGKKVSIKAHTRKAHTRKLKFTMPKRQFMGMSKPLKEKIERRIATAIQNVFL
jgi:phage gpG-like protein